MKRQTQSAGRGKNPSITDQNFTSAILTHLQENQSQPPAGNGAKSANANITKPSSSSDTPKKPRASKSKAREIWAADSETDPFKAGRIPKPFIWGAYNGHTYVQFRHTREFVDYFSSRECIVYAHNGGKFDWHFLLDDMVPWEPVMVINGRLAKFRIGKAEFRDSYNIMPMPLSAYKKDEIDYSLFEPDVREQHMPVIAEYLRSDCVYLFEMLTAFIEEFGLHLTQAGASIKAWERITGQKAPSTTAGFYSAFEPFYYGGRVQCFELGEIERDFVIVDINSAYPHAMMHEHPTGGTYAESPFLPVADDEICRAFITLRARATGAFPKRARDKSLTFPATGELMTFDVTGWEYMAARETGTLRDCEILRVITLPGKIEYRAYLNHFYDMKTQAKRDGDKARYEFAKRFLNSLYGKHGANPENYSEYTIVSPTDIEAAEVADGYEFAAMLGKWALVERPLPEERRRYYNVATAASITGFVRAMLWRAICQASGVIYCDTDAIMCEDPGGLDLDPERLGAWDVEARCTYGAIAAKKLYAVKTDKVHDAPDTDRHGKPVWKAACKGVRLNEQEIVRVARGETLKFIPENPSFSLKRGVSFVPRTVRMSATVELNPETD